MGVPVRYSVTVTSATQSPPLVMNQWCAPFNVGIGVISTSTGTSYTVQHTFEDPATFSTGTTWFDHADLASKTVSDDGNYAFPVRAIRITATNAFATVAGASLQMIVLQAGG